MYIDDQTVAKKEAEDIGLMLYYLINTHLGIGPKQEFHDNKGMKL